MGDDDLRAKGLALRDALGALDATARVDMPLSESVPAPAEAHLDRLDAALERAQDAANDYREAIGA